MLAISNRTAEHQTINRKYYTMKHYIILLTYLLLSNLSFAQTYDGLQKLDHLKQNVYFSKNEKERAIKILDNVAKAETYFEKEFGVHPTYTLLVLSPADWKKFAHPNAIYGIPHNPDGKTIIVASENNDFWKRITPPIDKISALLSEKLKNAYTDQNGKVTLTDFFDLLAVHELGHVFQKEAGLNAQRNWLNELLCNVLLHTFIAENQPKLLPALTAFPSVTVASFPADKLKYTKLQDFETNYQDIAQHYPDNYGWYQCRFHTFAGKIYDNGGVAAMNSLWTTLLNEKEKLNDQDLMNLLTNSNPALKQALVDWDE